MARYIRLPYVALFSVGIFNLWIGIFWNSAFNIIVGVGCLLCAVVFYKRHNAKGRART